MIVAYAVGGESKTLCVHGIRVEVALSLLPDDAQLEGVQYA